MSTRARDLIGPTIVIVLAVANIVLWAAAKPADQPGLRYVGEMLGAEAVLMFSMALVLVTLIPAIESAFNGMDRVALWHKYLAVAGVLLMLVHPAFASAEPLPGLSSLTVLGTGLGSLAQLGLLLLTLWALAPSLSRTRWGAPLKALARKSYSKWLSAHRLMGLFLIAAVAHGAMVDPVLEESTTLRVVYLTTGGIGIAAYLYRELLARHVIHVYDYTVSEATHLNGNTLDVRLAPTATPLVYQPGQFLMVAFGGTFGWERHPFTIDSSPGDPYLEVTIKASGDYTSMLHAGLTPGVPAKVVGPFGRFDYRQGGEEQVWIAGGVGVTPFLSWIRSLGDDFDRRVEFWYSVEHESDALFHDEIQAAAAKHPTFHPHLAVTSRDGHLTAQRAAADLEVGPSTWVFMCGPPPMTAALQQGFEALGVPKDHVRFERFGIR
jgi:predicted ferric reductase